MLTCLIKKANYLLMIIPKHHPVVRHLETAIKLNTTGFNSTKIIIFWLFKTSFGHYYFQNNDYTDLLKQALSCAHVLCTQQAIQIQRRITNSLYFIAVCLI